MGLVLIARYDDETRKWVDALIVEVTNSSVASKAFENYSMEPGEKLALWKLDHERPSTYVVGKDGEKLWTMDHGSR